MVEDNETFRTKGPFSDEIREKLNNFLIYNPTSNPTVEQKKMIEQQCGLNSHQIDNFFATLRYRLKRRHTPRYLNLPLLNKKQGNRSKKGTSKRVVSKSEQQKGSISGNQRENNINHRSVSTNSSSHTNQDKQQQFFQNPSYQQPKPSLAYQLKNQISPRIIAQASMFPNPYAKNYIQSYSYAVEPKRFLPSNSISMMNNPNTNLQSQKINYNQFDQLHSIQPHQFVFQQEKQNEEKKIINSFDKQKDKQDKKIQNKLTNNISEINNIKINKIEFTEKMKRKREEAEILTENKADNQIELNQDNLNESDSDDELVSEIESNQSSEGKLVDITINNQMQQDQSLQLKKKRKKRVRKWSTGQKRRRIDEDEDIDSTLISSYMVYPGSLNIFSANELSTYSNYNYNNQPILDEPESTQIAEEQRARLAALVVFGPYKRKQSARDFIHAMSLDLKMDGEDED